MRDGERGAAGGWVRFCDADEDGDPGALIVDASTCRRPWRQRPTGLRPPWMALPACTGDIVSGERGHRRRRVPHGPRWRTLPE